MIEGDGVVAVLQREGLDHREAQSLIVILALIMVAEDDVLLTRQLGSDLLGETIVAAEEEVT